MADGVSTRQVITHTAFVNVALGDHSEQSLCYVIDMHYDLILGMPWLATHNPKVNWANRSITFDSSFCQQNCLKKTPFTLISNSGLPNSFAPSFSPANASQISSSDYSVFMNTDKHIPFNQLQSMLPKQFKDFADVFLRKEADSLPSLRPGKDHEIKLRDGSSPPFKRSYPMSKDELLVVKKYIDENLAKGFIRPSSSPYSAPVLLVKKQSGGIRVCVDYRALNGLTIKNRYPIPLVSETMDRLSRAKYFTTLDVISAFNRIRIKPGHEEKTAFNTRYGQYEYLVMPFGLCNAPGSFQSLINDSIHDYLDDFATAYLDDILIYSESLQDHISHVRKVLERMRINNLQLDIQKCCFCTSKVKYLGLCISTEGLCMDHEKIEAITNWQTPSNLKDVRSFLGFANFYRRFIKNFSEIVTPLTNLTKSSSKIGNKQKPPFSWNDQCQSSFDRLKTAFTSAPILTHFEQGRETWVETDASDYVTAATLSQLVNGVLKPVAFLSKKLTPQECNYDIYDKELLSIIRAFEAWRPELIATALPVKVLSDHKNLEWFMTTKQLNRRQARWAEFLSQFNFKICYRPGSLGQKPDSLTRRSQDLPLGVDDARTRYQYQIVLRDHNLSDELKNNFVTPVTSLKLINTDVAPSIDMFDRICKAYERDPIVKELIELKKRNTQKLPNHLTHIRISLSDLHLRNNRLYHHDRLYIPEDDNLRTLVIKEHHDTPVAGHGGRRATYFLILRQYFWPTLLRDVETFVKSCHTCKRAKPFHTKYQGLLRPLDPPFHKWKHLSVDFAEDLPPCKYDGKIYHHILIVVDRCSKGRRFIPLTSLKVEEIASAFRRFVIAYDGYPETIVSDRGPQWTSGFWKRLLSRMGTKIKFTSAHHPESDGQSENAVKFLKQYLRMFVNYDEDNWVDLLPEAQLAALNHPNESTGLTPFFIDRGHHPNVSIHPPEIFSQGPAKIQQQLADDICNRVKKIQEHVQKSLVWAQAKQAQFSNNRRQPSPAYKVGDKVWLDARHLRTNRSSKLGHKNMGPFKISQIIHEGSAYKLDLPPTMTMHNVFHPWLLHPDESNPLPGQHNDSPPPVKIMRDNEIHEEFELDSIVNSRMFGSQLKYQATFVGDEIWNTKPSWQPWHHFKGSPYAIADFHHRYPAKPGPHKSYTVPLDWLPPDEDIIDSSS